MAVTTIHPAPFASIGAAAWPDVAVAQSWPDWRRGRDTALERALAG